MKGQKVKNHQAHIYSSTKRNSGAEPCADSSMKIIAQLCKDIVRLFLKNNMKYQLGKEYGISDNTLRKSLPWSCSWLLLFTHI